MSKLLAEWFWTDRWMCSSAFLLPMEPRGLYREMLTQAWMRRCRLPNDHEAIRRATGCSAPEWRRCWPAVERFWRVEADELVNDTQLEVWAEAVAKHQTAVEKGKRGAAAKAAAIASAQARLQAGLPVRPKLKVQPPSPSLIKKDQKPIGADAPKELTEEQKATNREIRAFLATFCELYTKFRHGAKYVVNAEKDVPLVRRLLSIHTRARLERLSELLQRTEDEWIAETDRSIGILSNRISWLDSRLAAAEAAAS
jgi:uncharacterized protein YdaU (DUF1376 family)